MRERKGNYTPENLDNWVIVKEVAKRANSKQVIFDAPSYFKRDVVLKIRNLETKELGYLVCIPLMSNYCGFTLNKRSAFSAFKDIGDAIIRKYQEGLRKEDDDFTISKAKRMVKTIMASNNAHLIRVPKDFF